MGIFGWSYPPGAANDPFAPYNQTGDEPIDLAEDKTLKGYGRRQHGLNGKDADLDTHGQNVVEEAYWHQDDTIRIVGRRYAVYCGPDGGTDEQWDLAHAIVCDAPGNVEWDGDYWIGGESYTLTVPCAWTDDETEEQNITRATRAAFEAIDADSEAFEKAVAEIHKALEDV